MSTDLAAHVALAPEGPTALAAAAADEALEQAAPELVEDFRHELAHAADVISRRVFGAAYREGLVDAPPEWSGGRVMFPRPGNGYLVVRAHKHAFDRLEVIEELPTDPAQLLVDLVGTADRDDLDRVGVEVADATVNLALAYARRRRIDVRLRDLAELAQAQDSLDLAWASTSDSDEQCLFFERLATEGHNLHPCGRTRLGWSVADVLAHDVESPGTHIALVGVRRDLHVGFDIGQDLARVYHQFQVALDPRKYALTPVHAWQLDEIVHGRYADLIEEGALAVLSNTEIPVWPTSSLRTVLLPRGSDGLRRYLKLSLDIQITSTRRSISAASAHNGPILSSLLDRFLAEDESDRVLIMAEPLGSAVLASDGRVRDLAAIVRTGLSGRLGPDELPVPALALPARSPITGVTVLEELVAAFARTRQLDSTTQAATAFLDEYAQLLLPPLLSLATRYGVALEAHLQNCIPTFVGGVPYRLAIRDLAGLRVHLPRQHPEPPLWPGSIIATYDGDVMRAKLAYTAFQAHLGELALRLATTHGLDEEAFWGRVRELTHEEYRYLARNHAYSERAVADYAYLTAPTIAHKALLRMRLAGAGDQYVPVTNPLHAP